MKKKKRFSNAFKWSLLSLSLFGVAVFASAPELNREYNEKILQAVSVANVAEGITQAWKNGTQIIEVDGLQLTGKTLSQKSEWTDQSDYIVESVVVKEPYFMTAGNNDKQFTIYGEKGKEQSFKFEAPVYSKTIDKQGSAYFIRQNKEGFEVVRYKKRGEEEILFEVKKDFLPMAMEVQPKGDVLIISWLDISTARLKSVIGVVDLRNSSISQVFFEKDNIVYEIVFVDDKNWKGIGDKREFINQLVF